MARYYKVSLNGQDIGYRCTEVFDDLKGYNILPIKPCGGYSDMNCHMKVKHIKNGKKGEVENALKRVIESLEYKLEYTVST